MRHSAMDLTRCYWR